MNYSPGRSRDSIEHRRATPPGPATPSGRSRRARGRPCEIPGSGKGLTTHRVRHFGFGRSSSFYNVDTFNTYTAFTT